MGVGVGVGVSVGVVDTGKAEEAEITKKTGKVGEAVGLSVE